MLIEKNYWYIFFLRKTFVIYQFLGKLILLLFFREIYYGIVLEGILISFIYMGQ